MSMNPWLESVYSDGSAAFVSDPAPALGATVTVRLRVYADAPVTAVILRSVPNGGEVLTPMTRGPVRRGLVHYEAPLYVNERRVQYQFYLVSGDQVWFYNQAGLSRVLPDQTHDFVLLTDYVQPAWVKEAVFYHIFPERFCNGDPSNDVRTGEYAVDGHPALARAWEDPVLDYEAGRCLDFYGGDLEGIRQKIPYLQALGVTALYLNPIFEAPSVHKYDCVDYLKVDPHFGGDEALARLSADLHAAGMKLILDISINHTGSAHKWFNKDCLWFDRSVGAYHNPEARERGYYFFQPDGSYKGWWDLPGLPVLNYTSEALRDAVYRAQDAVLRKWLRPPYSIDGWRFDVADVFARNDAVQLSHEIWPEIRKAIRAENPQAYILAEDWGDCAQYMQGDEWDAPMNYFGCTRPLRQFAGQRDLFMDRCEVLRALPGGLDAPSLAARVTQHLAKLPFALWENQFNLLDSHDVSRLHNDPTVPESLYRGTVMLQFLLIGAPTVYYGDESNIGGTQGTNEGCRWPMNWGSAPADTEPARRGAQCAPADEEPARYTENLPCLQGRGTGLKAGGGVPSADTEPARRGAQCAPADEDYPFQSTPRYRFYHRMISLKRTRQALKTGGMKFLWAQGGVAALARFTEDEALVAVVSTETAPQALRLPLSAIGAKCPKSKEDLFGAPLPWTPTQDGKAITLTLPPKTAVLFDCEMEV